MLINSEHSYWKRTHFRNISESTFHESQILSVVFTETCFLFCCLWSMILNSFILKIKISMLLTDCHTLLLTQVLRIWCYIKTISLISVSSCQFSFVLPTNRENLALHEDNFSQWILFISVSSYPLLFVFPINLYLREFGATSSRQFLLAYVLYQCF